MSLHDLKNHIQEYAPTDSGEDPNVVAKFLDLIECGQESILYREAFTPGHIVASGLVIDPEHQMILLNHHKALDLWLAFGGHVDGECHTAAAAAREVQEESGLAHPVLLTPDIIDLDIHMIPANDAKKEPQHLHYDVSYIYKASKNDHIKLSDESIDIKWYDFDAALNIVSRAAMQRLLHKAIYKVT